MVIGGPAPPEPPLLRLLMPARLLRRIRRHLEAVWPEEGCGVLVGAADGARRRVWSVVPVPNRDPGPENGYAVSPELLRDLLEAGDRGEGEVLGFYHSHPGGRPVPSERDRSCAWPRYLYLIVGVARGVAGPAVVWTFDAEGAPGEGRLETTRERREAPGPRSRCPGRSIPWREHARIAERRSDSTTSGERPGGTLPLR